MGKDQPLELPYPLILASTSRYRSDLLAQLGWHFSTRAPGVDEQKVKDTGLAPGELAARLSQLKAHAVFVTNSDSCVIGSDQVCTMDGRIFGKPGSVEAAREQLSMLQGRSHDLLTAVTVTYPSGSETFVNKTTLHMRPLGLREITAYVDRDRPTDCAGSYKLEARGIKLFSRIDMEDHTAVIGLPLIQLTSVLLKLGYPL